MVYLHTAWQDSFPQGFGKCKALQSNPLDINSNPAWRGTQYWRVHKWIYLCLYQVVKENLKNKIRIANALKRWAFSTYKANSSRSLRLYCFLGFMVLKRGSLMTSGQTAGQGLPHRRLSQKTQTKFVVEKKKGEIVKKNTSLISVSGHLMSSSCSSSWLAWKMGFFVKSSPKIHLDKDRIFKYNSQVLFCFPCTDRQSNRELPLQNVNWIKHWWWFVFPFVVVFF